MIRILAPILCVSVLFIACGGSQDTGLTDAQTTAAALRGDTTRAAADNPRCKLFTQAEVAKYIGEPVSAGRNAAGGAGCQWIATDGNGDAIVAIVPSNYHDRPSLVTGFREVADVGTEGFVAPELGGWGAGTIAGKDAIRVSVNGTAASEASALALLKETIRRHAS